MKADEHVLGKIELSSGSASQSGDMFLKQAQMGTALAPSLRAGGTLGCAQTGGHNYQAIVNKIIKKDSFDGETLTAMTQTNKCILFCTRCGDSKPLK